MRMREIARKIVRGRETEGERERERKIKRANEKWREKT